MPAAPKVLDADCAVWEIEVVDKIKAEHFSETDSHIAVTGKIKVNLKSITENCKPRIDRSERGNATGTNFRIYGSDGVRKNDLFSESSYKKERTGSKFTDIMFTLGKIFFNIVILNNGAGNELGEH